jgi:hypothetical protein
MRRPGWATRRRASTVTGALATLALVGLPVEITIGLLGEPVIAPPAAASFLLVGSCLLLVGSGLELRRLEAARSPERSPLPGA